MTPPGHIVIFPQTRASEHGAFYSTELLLFAAAFESRHQPKMSDVPAVVGHRDHVGGIVKPHHS
jgi:hypothetical protein